MEQTQNQETGSSAAIVIIVLILVIGGYFLFKDRAPEHGDDMHMHEDGTMHEGATHDESEAMSEAEAAAAIKALSTQSNSTEMEDIEADLEATDFSSMDRELDEENYSY